MRADEMTKERTVRADEMAKKRPVRADKMAKKRTADEWLTKTSCAPTSG